MRRFIGRSQIENQVNGDNAYIHSPYNGGDLNTWILENIDKYKQWYQPIDFGNGIVAHVTVPPDWSQKPELDSDYGLGRWDFIIKRNLPNVTEKRILDVGCNSGLYSIELSKLGATEVIGIDRDQFIPQKPDFLPRQNIVAQANFVLEAIKLVSGENFNVKYEACDFSNYSKLESLGNFDVIMALNVVYHELDGMKSILRTFKKMSKTLVLQTALGHGEPIAEWAKVETHIKILLELGYTNIKIDAPIGYLQPVIVAEHD